MNAWTDFLLTLYPLVFNVLPENLLDHLTNAEKDLCVLLFCNAPLYFVLVHLSLIFSLFVSSDILLSPICSDNGAA
jgi:hypothetical protein